MVEMLLSDTEGLDIKGIVSIRDELSLSLSDSELESVSRPAEARMPLLLILVSSIESRRIGGLGDTARVLFDSLCLFHCLLKRGGRLGKAGPNSTIPGMST